MLTIIDGFTDATSRNRTMFICKCDCGNHTTKNASQVIKNSIKSCGCLKKQHLSAFLANMCRGKQPKHTKPLGEAAKYGS